MKKTTTFGIHCMIALLLSAASHGQLTAWKYKMPVRILESGGTQKLNYQVHILLNTQALIAAGKMKADGSDIRVAKNCTGSVLYDYWVETGINTATTRIWVKVDTLAANATRIIYLYYGNSAATSASSFDNTFPAAKRKVVTASETLSALDTALVYDWYEIKSGATVNMDAGHQGTLSITARGIVINGKLIADGKGYIGGTGAAGMGPGGGQPSQNSIQSFNLGGGGGGGYGADGGDGGYCCDNTTYIGPGGHEYGSPTDAIVQAGSGGGAAAATTVHNPGGSGGGVLKLKAASIAVGDLISAKGANSSVTEANSTAGGGGGAGGGILLQTRTMSVTGKASVAGGNGGSATVGGGGGAGGRIKVFHRTLLADSSKFEIKGGIGGNSARSGSTKGVTGGTGSLFLNGAYASAEPTVAPFPLVLRSSHPANLLCPNTPITFTATPGYTSYSFYVNGFIVGSGADSTYTSSLLKDNDTVSVIGELAGCSFPADSIIVHPTTIRASFTALDVVFAGDTVHFADSSVSAITWLWDFGDSTFSSEQNARHVYQAAAQYTVTLIVSDGGCTDTISRVITIIARGGVEDASLSMEDVTLSVHPNPTSGIFDISFSQLAMQPLTLRIVDAKGAVVFEKYLGATPGHTLPLDFRNEPRGTYFIRLESHDLSIVRKLVVQ